MATTHIPPRDPTRPPDQQPAGSDLYNASHWEDAYRNTTVFDAPKLLPQYSDELSRVRRREAAWVSLVFHIIAILFLANTERLVKLLPARPTMVVAPNDWMRQRELTYLELPPDAQKITRRPNANIISDKDRLASHTPHVDPKELQKILDSARPGKPGPVAPAVPQPEQPVAQNNPPAAQKPAGNPHESMPAPPPNQTAQLQTPPVSPKVLFGGTVSAGSAIDQAARAAAANRGYSGSEGDFGVNPGRGSGAASNLDVLSDTMGVDFGPYLSRVLYTVRRNWYTLIPEVARAPIMKKGKVSIEFVILKDGRVANMGEAASSGDVSLDRAAWGSITNSNPFPPLPAEFQGQYLALRFHFYYNPDSNELR